VDCKFLILREFHPSAGLATFGKVLAKPIVVTRITKKFTALTLCPLTGLLSISLVLSACTGSIETQGTTPGQKPGDKPAPIGEKPSEPNVPPPPFDPQPPEAYVAKIKDLMTGEAPSTAEIQAVKDDPRALAGFVDGWRKGASYRGKLQTWLASAFQQNQIQDTDLNDQSGVTSLSGLIGTPATTLLKEALNTSFAMTMLQLINEGKPFTAATTTRTYMMSTAMMVYMAFLDANPVLDDGKKPTDSWISRRFPGVQTTITRAGTATDPTPSSPSAFDPTSANFMKFTFAPIDKGIDNCNAAYAYKNQEAIARPFSILFGRPAQNCNGRIASLIQDSDWTDHRMVTIRTAKSDNEHALYFEVAKLRNSKELVLGSERVGFMTTPGFFGTWGTNESNAFRVTANQTLITALALTFIEEGSSIPLDDSNLDDEHAQKGTPCYGCHVTLDPMRDFFRQDYGLLYGPRPTVELVTKGIPLEGSFSADDSLPVRGSGVAALGDALANHPRFALAWALKLCHLANSGFCLADDPELERIAKVFQTSNFNFNVLVKEIFSSPIVTFASRTKTGEEYGAIMSVARKDVLCDRLSMRLRQPDVCNLEGKSLLRTKLQNLAMGLPDAGYARGEVAPVLPKDPNLFFVSATDGICEALSRELVENTRTGVWTFVERDKAIADFSRALLGLDDGDPLKAASDAILQKHVDDALAAAASKGDALRSAFVVACTSPLSTSFGL